MDTGYYKFYEKKFKILLLLLACVVFCVGGYFMIKDTDSFYRLVGYATIIFFGLCFIMGSLKLCNNKAYIEITPTYIKIGNFEKCLWMDIVDITTSYNGESVFLHVKDVSKYKLTFWQRVNLSHGSTPFYIALMTLSQEDKEELKRILKERIPKNNLD